MKGWVYVMSSKSMPGIVKVGFTMRDPALRAKDLKHTGNPHPYDLHYEVLTEDPSEVEKRAHELLSDFNDAKEWFKCKPEFAASRIKQACEKIYLEQYFSVHQEENPINDLNLNAVNEDWIEEVVEDRVELDGDEVNDQDEFPHKESQRNRWNPEPGKYHPPSIEPAIGTKNDLLCHKCDVAIERSADLKWRCPDCGMRWTTVNAFYKARAGVEE